MVMQEVMPDSVFVAGRHAAQVHHHVHGDVLKLERVEWQRGCERELEPEQHARW